MARLRKHPEERSVVDLQFLHEQDGANERLLKAALGLVLKDYCVRRAYLVAVQEGSVKSVALCLVSAESTDLVEAIGAVVKQHLSRDASLDILFIRDAQQEARITDVCRPFHVAA